ncbi:MAG: Multi-sensor hybrid histidine kinase [Parcubacteria group bacterium LiPW_41]|nr:MAG: Multi-sensor hybrid histidine kinase [Parcubacteria group bacterium LiPW_41]
MRIKTKIVLIIATLVVVSAVITGITQYISSKQTVQKNINAHLESVITLKENQFSDFLEGKREYIEQIANETLFKKFLSELIEKGEKKEEISALLREKLLYQNGIFELFVLDTNGKILISTDKQQEGKFRSDEPYFISGKKNVFFQNFYHSIEIGKIASTVSIPIRDDAGKTIGVFAGRLNIEILSKLMAERSGLGETGETYLVNKYNTIVTQIRSNTSGTFSKMIYTEGIKNCLSGINGSHYTNYENVPVIGIHKWIQEKEICLVAEIKQSEAYSPIDSLRTLSIIVSLGSILFTIFIGRILARSISTPILKLKENTKQIAQGNLDTIISVNTNDEIGELAFDFKKMTGQLNEYTKNLKEEKAKLLSSINSLPLGFILFNNKSEIILKNNITKNILLEDEININEEMISNLIKKSKKFEIPIEECVNQKRICEFEKIEWKNKVLRIIFSPIVISKEEKQKTEEIMIGYVLIIEDVTKIETLSRTRDEFFAIASHELRTPLTAIKGNAELLGKFFEKEVKNEEVSEMVSDIQKESVRLISITNEFLDVSKIEQHQTNLQRIPINLNSITKTVIEELQVIAAQKRISIIFDENKNLVAAIGDRDRIHQILTNLIANAINHTVRGKIMVSISAENNYIKTSITDTGIGISDENKKYLFEKFQQAQTNIFTRGEEKGTGLGLYISKLLIEDMGGKIWLEKSEENIGSTFSFTLPAVV